MILLWGVMHIYGHLYLFRVFALALGLANWSSRHEQIPEGTLQNAGFELRLNAEASPGYNLFTKLFVLCYSVFSAFLQKQVQH